MDLKIKNINDYIRKAPQPVRAELERMRKAIRAAAPAAEEDIRYGMPTFRLSGNLVHFAAFKGHIGFYPTPSGITAFRKELAKYSVSKGAIRFPLGKPVPIALVKKITRYRVKESLRKSR